jgi:hypothetical protein
MRPALKKDDGRRNWTTIIECISATGRHLPPLVIWKGVNVQQQWFPTEGLEGFKEWLFTTSPKGWTSHAISLDWLTKIFIPRTKTVGNRPRLLIVDGHGSHCAEEFMVQCYKHNIHLLFLPPHASHVLQPLDLSVFSPLKAAYRRELGKLIYKDDDTPVGKRGFLQCYAKARQAGLAEKNVLAGWKATGLWPVNAAKPLMSRLLLNPLKSPPDTQEEQPAIEPPPVIANPPAKAVVATPSKSSDLAAFLRRFPLRLRRDPATRLLFQKLGKSLDAKNSTLATQGAQLLAFQRHTAEGRAAKRRKVDKEDPNRAFTNIADVIRTRKDMEPTIRVA